MQTIPIIEGITLKKYNTSTFTIVIRGKVKESNKITIEQRITRKFIELVDTIKEFFQAYPDYAFEYFKHLYQLSINNSNKNLQNKTFRLIKRGKELIDKFLEENGKFDQLKIPKGKIDLSKGDLVDKDRSILLIRYSWYLKLYMFVKFTTLRLDDDVDEKIMKSIANDIERAQLTQKILTIIKGKIISTLNSRKEMWNYLEYSVRKSPSVYISQLYHYTILYILLFMKDSYNPIGFLGDFINRQIIYIFSDVYVAEVVYHTFEDYHVKNYNLLQQNIVNDVFRELYASCVEVLPSVEKFIRKFQPAQILTSYFVLPVFKKIIMGTTELHITNLTHNLGIIHLYVALLLKGTFKMNYIPYLLTSNVMGSAKRLDLQNKTVVRKLNEIMKTQFPNTDVSNEIKQLLISISQHLYTNILDKKMFKFDPISFLDEFKIFLKIINDQDQIDMIREKLIETNFRLTKKSVPKAKGSKNDNKREVPQKHRGGKTESQRSEKRIDKNNKHAERRSSRNNRESARK